LWDNVNEFSVGWICVGIIDIKIASGVLNGMTISSAKLEEQSAVDTYIYCGRVYSLHHPPAVGYQSGS